MLVFERQNDKYVQVSRDDNPEFIIISLRKYGTWQADDMNQDDTMVAEELRQIADKLDDLNKL